MNHQKQRAYSVNKETAHGGDKKIRVLVAAPSLDIYGGQARQAVRLVERLNQEPSIEVAFIPHNPRLPVLLRWMQKIKYVRTVATTLLYVAMLIARVWRYDIVHVFSASYYSYLLSALPAVLIAKLYGKKTILNYRSGEAEDHLANWRTAIGTIRLADVIVVPSGYLVDVFARFGLEARAIFNIIELDRFSFRERAPLRPVFLTSRLLEPLYNVPCVLRAFAIIQKRYPEARLTIAADGFLRQELEQVARELELRDAEFIGFVPFERMPALYDAADIYLTATNIDNMPGSVTECMAAGLNVVTTDGGGAIPYIMTNEETGLIIERDNPEAMAAAAIRLLEDNELAMRLARNARESSRRFTWQEVQREWLKLYRQLAEEKAAPQSARAAGSEEVV
jgi:glycosyltransferase involved in cell wall biosynthesis